MGTGARYLLSGWALKALGPSFPFGTLFVNVLGSFLVAVLMYLGTETTTLPVNARIVLTTGVLGGFTTYSAFSFETMRHIQDGAWVVATVNVLVTVLGCLGACMLGWATAKWVVGT